MPVPLKVRWWAIEALRVFVVLLIPYELVRTGFDLQPTRLWLLPYDALFLVILFAFYVLISCTNLFPKLLPDGFVPRYVRPFTRWGFTDPVVRFESIYGIRMRTEAGRPLLMEIVTTEDRTYTLSLMPQFPEERDVALGILEWTKTHPPDRVIEGTGNIVLGWGSIAKSTAKRARERLDALDLQERSG